MRAPESPFWLAVLACAAVAMAPACSTSTTTSGGDQPEVPIDLKQSCLNGASGLDCGAQAVLLHEQTGQTLKPKSVVNVPVGGLQVGGTLAIPFRVRNAAAKESAAPLVIDDVTVKFDALSPDESAGGGAFSCAAGSGPCSARKGQWAAVVPVGLEDAGKKRLSEEVFTINYKQFDAKARSATVCVHTRGDTSLQPTNGKICFTLNAVQGKPKIAVDKQGVQFKYVQAGKSDEQTVTISNAGTVELCIPAIDFNAEAAGGAFTVLDPEGKAHKAGLPITFTPALCLKPGESATLTVQFAPQDEQPKQGTLVIRSTDTSKPNLTVLLKGNSSIPCITINPSPQVNFGATQVGQKVPRKIEVCSCGNEAVKITGVSLAPGSSDVFSLDLSEPGAPSDDKPWALSSGQCKSFTGTYLPVQPSAIDKATGAETPDTATLVVTSNASPQSVQMLGVCVKDICPQAKIKVTWNGEEVEQLPPQQVITLDGQMSTAPGGAGIKSYKWTVKKAPLGAPTTFVPSSSFPKPTYAANLAGNYEFCLSVVDDNGNSSAECDFDACAQISVLPSEALHIELVWDTPKDNDQQNTGPAAGADMDLHFAGPLAEQSSSIDLDCDGVGDPWFQPTFDTFWLNPHPQWGSFNTTGDDPNLDLDDTDGAGPENMNLKEPEGLADKLAIYDIGVHYWNDHGWGSSFPTVNIYILAQPYMAVKGPEMNTLDMWYVGKLRWPNSKAGGGSDEPLQQCWQTGDVCLGKTDPTNPKAGLMWQPKGDPCVRHCYISPLAPSSQTVCK